MAGKRSYDDGSLVAQALERIGERWALLIARELAFGPRRFGDLQTDLRTISPNVLTQRLAEMTAAGVIAHRQLPEAAGTWVYELTPWGHALEPALAALAAWAAQTPSPERALSAAAAAFDVRAAAEPTEGSRFSLRADLGGRSFHLRMGKQRLRVEPWTDGEADAVLAAAPGAFHHLVFRGRDLDAAIKAEAVVWNGERKAFSRLMALVPAVAGPTPAWATGAD